jgi:hypothetical protein
VAEFSGDTDTLTILAGLPQGETTFEYLAGCWKRLYVANREANRLVSGLRVTCLTSGPGRNRQSRLDSDCRQMSWTRHILHRNDTRGSDNVSPTQRVSIV